MRKRAKIIKRSMSGLLALYRQMLKKERLHNENVAVRQTGAHRFEHSSTILS